MKPRHTIYCPSVQLVATYSLLPGVLSASSVIIFCKKSRVIGEAYVGIGSFLYQTHNNKGLGMLFASPYDAADSSWYESMLPLPPSSNTPTISSMGTTPSIGPGWVVSSASLGKIQRTALPATPHR